MDTQNVSQNNGTKKVLMFPWLAVGHITPFLELAKKLSDRGFHSIHLCSTPINLSFIKNKIPQKYSFSIQLVELHLPELPNLPSTYHTTNGLPPHLNSSLEEALKMAEPTFSDIFRTMKPDLLIYDFMQPWAAAVAKSHQVPAVLFFTSGAATFLPSSRNLSTQMTSEVDVSTRYHRRYGGIGTKEYSESEKIVENMNDLVLISSSRELEGENVDRMSEELGGSKILPVGMLVQEPVKDDGEGDFDELMEWLGKKEEKSTVFASFGSEYYLSDDDMKEVALGLEQSGANFIWVVRFPKNDETYQRNVEEALPKGYLDRVEGRGRVVEWVPQGRILSHPNIGGFMSHCGWNSLMESIACGVPIIAMPMQFEQPGNAVFIVNTGLGIEVVRDATEKLHREDIGRVVNDVIQGKVGESLRRNVKVMGENVNLKSLKEMDDAGLVLAQLCNT